MNENADYTSQELVVLRYFNCGLNTADITRKFGNLLYDEAEIDRILTRALEKRRASRLKH